MKDLRDPLRRRILSLVGNFLPIRHQVIRRWEGQTPLGRHRRLVLFAHFDPAGIVEDYVLHYLRELARLGSDIVFVTSSPRFPEAEAAKTTCYCARVVHRRNVSLDFGSWRIAFEEVARPEDYDQIVLANDSVYGPLRDLGPVFAEMDGRGLDLWGITDSLEKRPHLQSYFLVFNTRLIRSGFFARFWRDFRFHWSKVRIISRYEIGLTTRARAEGASIGAWVPSEEVRARLLSRPGAFQYRAELERQPLNTTLFFWDELVREFKSPFLKTEALKLDRFRSQAIARWSESVRGGGFDPAWIQKHLERVARGSRALSASQEAK